MSMMDTLNAAPPQGQQPSPDAAQAGALNPGAAQAGQQPGTFVRLSEGGDLQEQFNKLMSLTSSELWQKGMADLVNEQMLQDESDPSAIVGKFVSFLLGMCNGAMNSKQQAPEPIVMAGIAEQMADQMTDIGLNNETVAPGDADDVAEAGALIGIQLFLQQNGQQIQAADLEEYKNILTQLIQNAPDAAEMAEDNLDDAAEVDVPDTASDEEGGDEAQAPYPGQSMASSLGGGQ